MFNRPGSKIKGLAKVLFVLQIIAFSLGGVYLIFMGAQTSRYSSEGGLLILAGVAAIGVGILIAWLSVLFIYAYGSMVDDVESIRTAMIHQAYSAPSYPSAPAYSSSQSYSAGQSYSSAPDYSSGQSYSSGQGYSSNYEAK